MSTHHREDETPCVDDGDVTFESGGSGRSSADDDLRPLDQLKNVMVEGSSLIVCLLVVDVASIPVRP